MFKMNVIKRIAYLFPVKQFCFFVNLTNCIKGKKKRLLYDAAKKKIIVTNNSQKIYIARRSRQVLYSKGIDSRLNQLAKDYFMNTITFYDNDIIIDCGANIGEIGMWAKPLNILYYPIEPEAEEADCCDLNNFGGCRQTTRKALWHENGIRILYSKPHSADSSLILMDKDAAQKEIETITLDTFCLQKKIGAIKLLKIDAEGGEPEVLLGAMNTLPRINYIAVDCGYERGIKENHTFKEVNTILSDFNFKILDVNFKRETFLYKRREANLK